MGDTSKQLVQHLEQQRRELLDNVVELENKVTRAVSWRSHVEQRPMMMVGLAFGGGALLSALLGGPRRPLEIPGSAHREPTGSATWENFKGALLGLALAKAGNAVEDLLPGFREQYHKAEAGPTRSEPLPRTP